MKRNNARETKYVLSLYTNQTNLLRANPKLINPIPKSTNEAGSGTVFTNKLPAPSLVSDKREQLVPKSQGPMTVAGLLIVLVVSTSKNN